MRGNSGSQLCELNGALEGRFDRRDRLSVELNEVLRIWMDTLNFGGSATSICAVA
jgi:hypothetical protein